MARNRCMTFGEGFTAFLLVMIICATWFCVELLRADVADSAERQRTARTIIEGRDRSSDLKLRIEAEREARANMMQWQALLQKLRGRDAEEPPLFDLPERPSGSL